MDGSEFDAWVKQRVDRYNNEARWRRNVGNFGFGFIFVGFLLNCAVFLLAVATNNGLLGVYRPWWAGYLVLSCLAGLYWAVRSRRPQPGDA